MSANERPNETAAAGASVGKPVDRADGRLKVTGAARFAVEFPLENLAHAVLVGAEVSNGTIARIDAAAAERAPGVLAVVTYKNAPRLKPVLPQQGDPNQVDPATAARRLPLQEPTIYHSDQYVAVVVAERLEQAQHAATLVKVTYAEKPPAIGLARERAKAAPPKGKVAGKPAQTERGGAAAGLAAGAARVDAVYRTPTEHHNPMEPHATTAVWEGEKLTVYDATQHTYGVRSGLAATFGIPEENVRCVSKFVGGGFGSKGTTWSHVPLAAVAARVVKRPVRLTLTRRQMFSNVGHRAETEQRVALGASKDGRLSSVVHEGLSHTSTFDEYVEPFTKATHMMYATPNLRTSQKLVALNVGTPTYMRAPGESSGSFALEAALDELAYELKMDPIELRLANYAESDPDTKLPWSTKALRECYRVGAERFGWSRRAATPRSTRDGRMLVGLGMASAVYPVNHFPSSARVRVFADGTAVAESSTHELGTGTYTVLAQIAADALGLPVDRVRADIGDTNLPRARVSGGSSTVMSVGTSVDRAARAAVAKLAELARADARSPLAGAAPDRVAARDGRLVLADDASRGETFQAILGRAGLEKIEANGAIDFGENEKKEFSMHSFGAHFAEVRVDPDFGEVRVARVTGVYGVGRAMNRKTVASQFTGGIVMGIGMALTEETVYDPRLGRVVNSDLAEYHVPVNADVPAIDVHIVEEFDPHASPIGAKGVGEIGIVGVAAAIANAVYNATGIRVRDLPITLDKLLARPPVRRA